MCTEEISNYCVIEIVKDLQSIIDRDLSMILFSSLILRENETYDALQPSFYESLERATDLHMLNFM